MDLEGSWATVVLDEKVGGEDKFVFPASAVRPK